MKSNAHHVIIRIEDFALVRRLAYHFRESFTASQPGGIGCLIRGDMTKRLPFEAESFDIIFHPVSNCYVEEVKPIWKECYRILKPSGILLPGMDNGINFLFTGDDEKEVVNSFPFNPLKNAEQMKQLEKDNDGVQFSHTLEEQIGGQLEAGFQLTDLYEDTNGSGRLHEMNIPCFIATRGLKI